MIATLETLDDYLTRYGGLLGHQAQQSLDPLHNPESDDPVDPLFLRDLYPAQAHVAAAGVKALDRHPAVMFVGECGVGKTLVSMAMAHEHARGKPYRAIVMCPPQLPGKWEREILETIPDCRVRRIRSYRDLVRLDPTVPPAQPEWWIITETAAKLGAAWRPAYTLWKNRSCHSHPKMVVPHCPHCGQAVLTPKGEPMPPDALHKRKQFHVGSKDDPGCGEALWTYTSEIDKWAPAQFIHKHLRGYWGYFICDELHEENSATSARANAMGTIAASCRKFIGLTGTLSAGYAWHLKSILLRVSPTSLVAEGLDWSKQTAFNERYGRIETRVTSKSSAPSDSNRQSRGSKTSTQKMVRPGVMPSLFGRHLIDKCVFLQLDELADNLPPYNEHIVSVKMDPELDRCYAYVEDELRQAVKRMLARGDKRLLAAMLQTLLTYPDHPFDWNEVGYWEKIETGTRIEKIFIPVVQPENLDRKLRNKEKSLVHHVLREHEEGRQVWVYVNNTQTWDVQRIVRDALESKNLRVKVLSSSVGTAKREDWIAKHAPSQDVIVSHPMLVRTGLDLFGKGGRHNFTSLMFYQTGYDLFTLRQAARRSWRIGQTLPCRTFYFYDAGTMQARAMTLMGKKLIASESIEGKFSSEGLAAMGEDDEGSMEMAMAKSLIDRLDDLGADRIWRKVSQLQGNFSGTKQRRVTA